MVLPAPSTDLSAWINQQLQGAQTATQTTAISQTGGTTISTTLSSSSGCIQAGMSACCGTDYSCPSEGNTDNQTPATVAPPCDPLGAAYGHKVTLVLDGNLVLTGTLVMECRGLLVISGIPDGKTLVVNIQKLVYMQID